MAQVSHLLLTGLSEKEIAAKLGVSPHTVHVYVRAVYRAYGAGSRAEYMTLFVSRRTTDVAGAAGLPDGHRQALQCTYCAQRLDVHRIARRETELLAATLQCRELTKLASNLAVQLADLIGRKPLGVHLDTVASREAGRDGASES